MSGKLEPVYVPADDVDIFAVSDEGWYVIDDDRVIIDGPFENEKACLKVIAEMQKPQAA